MQVRQVATDIAAPDCGGGSGDGGEKEALKRVGATASDDEELCKWRTTSGRSRRLASIYSATCVKGRGKVNG